MRTELAEEAIEFGRLAKAALGAAGGDELVRAGEADPVARESLVATLEELGAWDLDVRDNVDDLEAAAALCRAVGYWAIPYPVAERLCRPTGLDADGLVVVTAERPMGRIAGLDRKWVAVTLDGRRSWAMPTAGDSPRYSAFATELELDSIDDAGAPDVALGLTLPCWTLLGHLDRAIELSASYVLEREQFGQTLASFQGVQFHLTDAELERIGVEELAKYALWSIEINSINAVADALALRLAAVDAAEVVFWVAHQLHGAIGFCDETTLSWTSRYSQALRRFPLGRSQTLTVLTADIGSFGLSGLFNADAARTDDV